MTFQAGHTPSHKGKITTTRPLLWDELQAVKSVVQNAPRDKALLSLALATGLRASDLREIRWDELQDNGETITVTIRARKTGKLKLIVLNSTASADVRAWREHCPFEFIASGQRGQLSVSSIARLVKDWAGQAGLNTKHVASHSLRKARCRALVEHFKEPLYVVMRDLQHSSEAQTAAYIGITTKDQQRLYEHVI